MRRRLGFVEYKGAEGKTSGLWDLQLDMDVVDAEQVPLMVRGVVGDVVILLLGNLGGKAAGDMAVLEVALGGEVPLEPELLEGEMEHQRAGTEHEPPS
ncbi:hypothetical protein GC173_15805 [bacterium]|nr:hypothetical protein [bacterium]